MINLTTDAAKEISRLMEGEESYLRLAVAGGGCAGFEYYLDLESTWDKSDQSQVFTSEGIKVLVDPYSLPLIKGSVIDWSGGLSGKGFVVNNPNVSGGCGCGKSFSIDEDIYDEEGRLMSPCDTC